MARIIEELKQVFDLGGVSWKELGRRVFDCVQRTNCIGNAAALAYYFLFSLFPFLLFFTALLAYLPVANLLEQMMALLAQVMPGEAHQLVRNYLNDLLKQPRSGVLSFGILFALWTASNAMTAVSDGLNHAYGVEEGRPFWKVRGLAVLLTIGLCVFIIASIVLLIFGPQIGGYIAGWVGLGEIFQTAWNILRWPVILVLVTTAVAAIYYYAPDVEQQWKWITPGSVFAVIMWVLLSLGFSYYVNNFGSYDKTYGSIGAIIVLLTWMYASGLAILVGGVINAQIEHANPLGKSPGEKQQPPDQVRFIPPPSANGSALQYP
jgi:membrane protein